jgi:hypothetical protein
MTFIMHLEPLRGPERHGPLPSLKAYKHNKNIKIHETHTATDHMKHPTYNTTANTHDDATARYNN